MARMQQVRALAMQLMDTHGITRLGWKFQFDRAKTLCGQCDYKFKIVSLSRYYASDKTVPLSDIKNTILHEIAHVLAGSAALHGPRWKRIARYIGCDGATCNHVWHGAVAKYNIKCDCGAINIQRYRLCSKFKEGVCASCRTMRVIRLCV